MSDVDKTRSDVKHSGEFFVDAITPESIPMVRLSEYMGALANFLGSKNSVHFDRIEAGSLKLKYWVEPDEIHAIAERALSVTTGNAEKSTLAAFDRMNDLLEADHAIGIHSGFGTLLHFPGRERAIANPYGQIEEITSIEGQLVRIGGRDKSIHCLLQDGDRFFRCEMSRALAMDLRHFLFGPTVRITGTSRFSRQRDGDWTQLSFKAVEFEELDDSSLIEVVQKVMQFEGNGWFTCDAPFAELAHIQSEV
jgi:hypothetical protein